MLFTQEIWTLLLFLDLFLLGTVAVYAFYSYYKRLGELKKVQIDSYKKAEEVIKEADTRSREILDKVEQKAEEILRHSELFKSDLNNDFKDSLKQLAQSYAQVIQEHSKKFTLDYENILTSVKNESLLRAKQALDNIENEVAKQLNESKGSLNSEMTKSLAKAQTVIDQYRRSELDKVDHDIDQLVVQMAKDLLRINLEPKDHRKLVMQALEKAKEQGAFFL